MCIIKTTIVVYTNKPVNEMKNCEQNCLCVVPNGSK